MSLKNAISSAVQDLVQNGKRALRRLTCQLNCADVNSIGFERKKVARANEAAEFLS
jgi:hypothetical protein